MIAAPLLISSHCIARENLMINGFLTIAAGVNLSGEREGTIAGNSGVDCPCSITDWSNAGIYEEHELSFEPDSKLGLQLKYSFTDWTSFTGQVISRGTDLTPDLSWAFFTFKINDNWSVQAGRKRIPLYYYSDFQDVGFSYPWITPPDELYGWDATNYNGISIAYNNNFMGMNLNVSLFTGEEKIEDNDFVETFSSEPADTDWKDIAGVEFELRGQWWHLRMMYLTARTVTNFYTIDSVSEDDQTTMSLAFNGELDSWFFRTEFAQNLTEDSNSKFELKAPAFTVGVGTYLSENWTLFTSYNQYRERANVKHDFPYRYSSMSWVVRYYLNDTSSIKVQYNFQDDYGWEFEGDSELLRVAYDLVF